MNEKNWLNDVKQKFQEYLSRELILPKKQSFMSHDKLPPRIQLRGISVAARVVGHEIRNFTKRTTGKDLTSLRESRTRHQMLTKLSELQVKISNKHTKYNLLTLACCHSTNFTTSLSPVSDCTLQDAELDKNGFHVFIAKYYKRCIDEHKNEGNEENVSKKKVAKRHSFKRKSQVLTESNNSQAPCKCFESNVEKKIQHSTFLKCWEHNGIEEEKLNKYLMENIQHFQNHSRKFELNISDDSDWSEFMRNAQCIVFRKKLKNGLYEYRVQASFADITANNLFTIQLDGEYRKKWDEYVVDLRVADSHQPTSSDLIHWVTKCPYPFATREYVYLRRKKIDEDNKALILYQEATDKTNIPRETSVQRVDTYLSKIIIVPHHGDFDEIGCDFLLTYYDDPKMRLPQRVLDLAAYKGIETSVDRMHAAALRLNEQTKKAKNN